MLTVRAPVGWAVNWVAERLPAFLDAYPKVPVRIVSSVWSDDAETERYDLDVRYGTGKWRGIVAQRVTWERIEPLCTPEIATRLRSLDDLATERLLHVLGYKEGWATWLAAAGAARVNAGAGQQFDSSLMAFEVAANGGGIALGRTSMSAKEVRSGRLVRPFSLSVPVQEAFYVLTPEEGLSHPDAALFRDWLVAKAEEDRVAQNPTAHGA